MPVFFGVAGLSIDLSVLRNFHLLFLAFGLIAIASFGKIVGCYVGGRVGGLPHKESTALALGMNARGSTEVIVATIGLSMGVLSQELFTLIVIMAISTTMITPPLLRWSLVRIPPTGEERERLEREAAEENDFVPKVQRVLIAVEKGKNGKLASLLAGYFTGTQKMLSTVVELKSPEDVARPSTPLVDIVKNSADTAAAAPGIPENATGSESVSSITLSPEESAQATSALLNECRKGYDVLFFGVEFSATEQKISIPEVIAEFKGLTAIALARERNLPPILRAAPLKILVPTIGTDYSRRGAELAIAIAKGCGGSVTALHVAPPAAYGISLRKPLETIRVGRDLVKEILELARRQGVPASTELRKSRKVESEILRQAKRGKFDLLVLGVKTRPSAELFFGSRVSLLRDQAPCSLLIVSS
jgi:nucleotide-binding universal stress UspA family protein